MNIFQKYPYFGNIAACMIVFLVSLSFFAFLNLISLKDNGILNIDKAIILSSIITLIFIYLKNQVDKKRVIWMEFFLGNSFITVTYILMNRANNGFISELLFNTSILTFMFIFLSSLLLLTLSVFATHSALATESEDKNIKKDITKRHIQATKVLNKKFITSIRC